VVAVNDHRQQASFYRAALLLGLVRGSVVVQWADEVIAEATDVPAAFIEIASTPPDDVTALRLALLGVCDERESPAVVRAVLAHVGRDLSSGRRGFSDTMAVLKQVRQLLRVDPAVNDQLKAFAVELAHVSDEAERGRYEQRIGAWLLEAQ
jgi:hypothetical protein